MYPYDLGMQQVQRVLELVQAVEDQDGRISSLPPNNRGNIEGIRKDFGHPIG
jgi:hypothetical protein